MEKKSVKKLVVKREVLRELSRQETRAIAGGWYTDTCDTCACNG